MSNVKISALPAATTPLTGTELVPLVQSGVTSQVAVSNIKTAPAGSTTQVQYNNAGAFGGISGVTTDGTRMTASTTIGVGAATPSASGAGITFPATQSASTDANTLDDYEEGTYTPTITTTTGSITLNSSYNTLSYIKIGQLVTITGRIRVTSVSLPTGRLLFTIPFNTTAGTQESGRGQCFGVGVESATVSMNSYMIDWAPSSSTIEIALLVGASYTNAAPNITASSLFSFAFSYRCTA